MGGKMSRNKGSRGEREVMSLLQPVVDRVCDQAGHPRFELTRDQRQRFEEKRLDVIGLPWLAMEVKRQEALQIKKWWRQTRDGTRAGQIPVLFWRKNRNPWRVRTRLPISVVKGGWVGPDGKASDGTGEGDTYQRPVRIITTVNMLATDWLVWFEVRLKQEIQPRIHL